MDIFCVKVTSSEIEWFYVCAKKNNKKSNMMPCGYSTPQSFCHLNKSPFRVLIQRQAHQCIFETLWIRTPCSLYIQLPFGAQQQAYIHSHKHKGNDQQWVIFRPRKLPCLDVIFDSKVFNSALLRKTCTDKKIADGQF